MLGNHVIGTSAQVTSRFDEFGGTLFYLNRTHRWNWGVSVDQIPYVCGSFAAGFVGEHLCRAGVPLPPARSVVVRVHDLSVQSFASGRGLGRLPAHRAELRPHRADVLDVDGPAAVGGRNPARVVPDAEPRRGEHGARLRHVNLRPDEPDPWQPLSPRVLAERRLADVFGCAGGRADVFHAAAARTPSRFAACITGGSGRTRRTGACRRSSSAIPASCAATIRTRSRSAECAAAWTARAPRSIA